MTQPYVTTNNYYETRITLSFNASVLSIKLTNILNNYGQSYNNYHNSSLHVPVRNYCNYLFTMAKQILVSVENN